MHEAKQHESTTSHEKSSNSLVLQLGALAIALVAGKFIFDNLGKAFK